MCQFSNMAEKSRQAKRGEILVVTPSPHSDINWATAAGQPEEVVCLLHGTVLAVAVPSGEMRGARFEQDDSLIDHQADSIVYMDGAGERVLFYRLPIGTELTVLKHPENLVEFFTLADCIEAAMDSEDHVLVGAR